MVEETLHEPDSRFCCYTTYLWPNVEALVLPRYIGLSRTSGKRAPCCEAVRCTLVGEYLLLLWNPPGRHFVFTDFRIQSMNSLTSECKVWNHWIQNAKYEITDFRMQNSSLWARICRQFGDFTLLRFQSLEKFRSLLLIWENISKLLSKSSEVLQKLTTMCIFYPLFNTQNFFETETIKFFHIYSNILLGYTTLIFLFFYC